MARRLPAIAVHLQRIQSGRLMVMKLNDEDF